MGFGLVGVFGGFIYLFIYLLLWYAQNQIEDIFTLSYFHIMVQLAVGLLPIIIIYNLTKLCNYYLMIGEHL